MVMEPGTINELREESAMRSPVLAILWENWRLTRLETVQRVAQGIVLPGAVLAGSVTRTTLGPAATGFRPCPRVFRAGWGTAQGIPEAAAAPQDTDRGFRRRGGCGLAA